MLLGIISDIHADFEALAIGLDLLVGKRVDKIVCLGDVVEKGYDGDACAERLQQWLIPCVRGNHDDLAIENQGQGDDLRWHDLKPNTLDFLSNLPMTRYCHIEMKRFLLCHGTPTDNWDYLSEAMAAPKKFKKVASQNDADVILCGHSHVPMDVTYGGVRFLNPGSICGKHTRGSRTVATLRIPDMQFHVIDIP